MHNKLRILSLITVIITLCSVIVLPVYAENDVIISEDAEKNYEKLNALGLVNDVLTDYKAEVTRGEFLSFIYPMYRALSGNDTGAAEQVFSDIAADSELYKPVMLAYELGLISGTNDAMFEPDERITYEQAAKILMVILGYKTVAESDGGYPAGYLKWAVRSGIETYSGNGAGSILIWGDVVEMVNSAAEADYLRQVTFDDDTFKNNGGSFLSEILDIEKVSGIVEANPFTSIYSTDGADKGYITVESKQYKADKNMYEFLGQKAELYYKDTGSGTREALYIRSDNGGMTDIDTEDARLTDNKIYYYDNDGKEQNVQISDSAIWIYNEKLCAVDDIPSLDECDEIKAIKWESGSYNVVKVYDYTTARITEINKAEKILNLDNGKVRLTADKSDEEALYIEYDGKEIEFDELKTDDIISYMISSAEGYRLEKFLVCRTKVRGTVEEIKDDKITIDGNEYSADKKITDNIKLDSEGTFYLNCFGKIVDTDNNKEMVYGYLYRVKREGFDSVLAKIFTERSRWVEVYLKNKIKYNGSTVTAKDLLTKTELFSVPGQASSIKPQMVTYRVNDKNELAELNCAVDLRGKSFDDRQVAEAIDNGTFRLSISDFSTSTVEWRTSQQCFSNALYLKPGAFVFRIPGEYGDANIDEDKIKVEPISNLSGRFNSNEIYAYDVDKLVQAPMIAVYKEAELNSLSNLFIVESVHKGLNVKGESCISMSGGYNGNVMDVFLDSDIKETYSPGDVLQVSFGADGSIEKAEIKYDYDNKESHLKTSRIYAESCFVDGEITDVDSDGAIFSLKYTDGGSRAAFRYTSAAKFYVVDNERECVVKPGDSSDLMIGDTVLVFSNYSNVKEIVIYRKNKVCN